MLPHLLYIELHEFEASPGVLLNATKCNEEILSLYSHACVPLICTHYLHCSGNIHAFLFSLGFKQ